MWLHLYHLESVSLGSPTVASLRSVAVPLGSPMAASVMFLGRMILRSVVMMEVVFLVPHPYKHPPGSSLVARKLMA